MATSLSLSRKLAAPISTVQRRRQRLEENHLEQSCSLKVHKFGWSTAVVFVSTNSRAIESVAKEILEIDDSVTLVTQMVGADTIDLKVDVLFKSRPQLQFLLERIKSLNGVNSIFWSEPVQILGKNSKCYEMMLESV
jgi:DNA-binding Lrp family transcriptional regulator